MRAFDHVPVLKGRRGLAVVLWPAPEAEMNTITLLRHSLTAANEAHLYCGVTDLPLSSAGIAWLTASSISGFISGGKT